MFAAGLVATFAIPSGSDNAFASTALTLQVVSENATGMVVSWSPPAGTEGYEFKRDGAQIATSWDPNLNEWSFDKPSGTHTYEVDAVMIGSSGSLVRPVTFVTDSYTSPDGTLLTAHTPEVGGAIASHPSGGGNIGNLKSNELVSDGSTLGIYDYGATPPSTDYSVSATLDVRSIVNSEIVAVAARLDTTALTGYFLQWSQVAGAWRLIKEVAGTGTVLATVTSTPSVGAHTMKLTVSGTSSVQLVGTIDGVDRLTATDSTNPITAAAKVGVEIRKSAAAGTGIWLDNLSADTVASTPPPTTTTTPTTTTAQAVINPGDSWNTAYQNANPGDVISVQPGAYGDQVISYRADLANSSKSPVTFRVDGAATASKLEIHGNDLVVEGNNQLNVTGYIDTEADSATQHPDHVTVQDAHSTSFGVFNADTVTFKNLDVGPATVSTGCATLQGNGFENKIGSAGGIVYNPTNITLDGLKIHDQNGDSGRINSDCHDGGLFLAGVSGLTVKNTLMQGNVVYNVQIQPINGAPVTAVTFDHDSFGCPVNWLYQNDNPLACDGQSSIQFDGTFPGVAITNDAFAEGVGANGWGCYAGTCDYSQDTFANNELLAQSTTAPPLP